MSLTTRKFYSMLVGGILSSIVVSLVMISDSIIAGIMLGDTAVAGINLVAPIYSMAAALGLMFSLGEPILYSKAIGDFDEEEACHVFRFGFTISILVGILLFSLLLLAGNPYLSTFHVSPEIQDSARKYLFWIRLDIMLLPMSTFLPGMVYCDGDAMLGSTSRIASSLANAILSIFLGKIYGITGIGIGTLAGTLLGLFICCLHFPRKRNSLRIGFWFSTSMLISIIRYSIIDASGFLFLSGFTAFINSHLVIQFGSGSLILAALITLVIEILFFLDGIGAAMTPIMEIYLPVRCFTGVKVLWKDAQRAALSIGILTALLLMALAPCFPALLGIEDMATISTAITEIRILAIVSPFIALLYLLTSYYILVDRIMLGVMLQGLYQLFLPVPLMFLFGHAFGIYGEFVGFVAATALSYLCAWLYVRLRHGKKAWPLLLPEEAKGEMSFLYDFVIDPEDIIRTEEKIREDLGQEGLTEAHLLQVTLLFEEVFMEVYQKNPGKRVRGECDIVLSEDNLQLIEMDDGMLFQFSSDSTPHSYREYVLSRIIAEWADSSTHIQAVSFNRNKYKIQLTEENAHVVTHRR